MKKNYIFFLAIIIMLTSCNFLNAESLIKKMKPIKESGNVITKTFALDSFNEIEVEGSLKVTIIQQKGKSEAVVKGSDNVVDALELICDDGDLKVRFKRGANISYTKLDIIVYASKLNSVDVAGSGGVTIKDVLQSKTLECSVSGSGFIKAESIISDKVETNVAGSGSISLEGIKSHEVEADIAGSGVITLTGATKKANFDIAGSGEIKAFGLTAKKGEAKITGSGVINCKVEKLEKEITGSGRILNREQKD